MIKKIASACTAVVLGAALTVGGISTASAEEAPVEVVEVVETVAAPEETPAVETVVAEPAVEAPVVLVVEEPVVAEIVEEPVVAEPIVAKATSPPAAKSNGYDPKLNDPKTWENTDHKSYCYKHEASSTGASSNEHGSSMGSTVTLKEFLETFKGDHWERLVIKAGTENAVYEHPVAGTAYSAPNDKDVSHWIVCKGETPAPVCPEYDFPKDKMWEVTWGWDFENRNGNAPKFTMTSNGGLIGVNGGPVPAYMLNYKTGVEWQWLYVTTDRVVTYQFADGTVWTAVVTGTECTPEIVWTMVPPPVKVPTVEFSYTVECGVLTLHTSSKDINPNWWYGIKATVNGDMVGSAVLQGNGTKVKVINFGEDSYGGSVDVVVETYASTEQDLLPEGWELGVQHEVTIDTDCEVNVPDAPEPESDTKFESTTDCEARTVSTQEFERHTLEPVYNEETNTWTQGEWTDWAPVGEPVVRDATEEECPTPPVVEPPVDTPPVVEPPAKAASLPFTGPAEWLKIVAGFAGGGVLLGTGLMLIRRRLALQ